MTVTYLELQILLKLQIVSLVWRKSWNKLFKEKSSNQNGSNSLYLVQSRIKDLHLDCNLVIYWSLQKKSPSNIHKANFLKAKRKRQGIPIAQEDIAMT